MLPDKLILNQLARIEQKLDLLITLLSQRQSQSKASTIDETERDAAIASIATTILDRSPAHNSLQPEPQPDTKQREGTKAWLVRIQGTTALEYPLHEGLNRVGSGERDQVKLTTEPDIEPGHVDVLIKEGGAQLVVRKAGVVGEDAEEFVLGTRIDLTQHPGFRIGQTRFTVSKEAKPL